MGKKEKNKRLIYKFCPKYFFKKREKKTILEKKEIQNKVNFTDLKLVYIKIETVETCQMTNHR